MIDFKLYAITDSYCCAPTPLFDVILQLLDVGVKSIQLREKALDDAALYKLAKPIAERCNLYGAALFINTNVTVAQDVGAAGVHLPAYTGSVEAVKEQLGVCRVGCSIHNFEEAERREQEEADFMTYSPIYPTRSKPGYRPALGVENLAALIEQVKLPIFALGGITPDRVAACMDAGASGIAVMSGLMSDTDAAVQASAYLNALRSVPKGQVSGK